MEILARIILRRQPLSQMLSRLDSSIPTVAPLPRLALALGGQSIVDDGGKPGGMRPVIQLGDGTFRLATSPSHCYLVALCQAIAQLCYRLVT